MKRFLLYVLCAICGMILPACTSTTYREGTVVFSRTAFFSKQTISNIEVEATKDGGRKLSVKGYSNEAAANAASIAEGVARGLRPVP